MLRPVTNQHKKSPGTETRAARHKLIYGYLTIVNCTFSFLVSEETLQL